MRKIINFTNDMGNMPATNCGLTAVASLISCYTSVGGMIFLQDMECKFPPDLDKFGSSPHHLESVLKQYGWNPKRRKLNLKTLAKCPAIVMLQIDRKGKLPMAHYCVAYDYKDGLIDLTNWDASVSYGLFTSLNSKWIPSLARMNDMGIVVGVKNASNERTL